MTQITLRPIELTNFKGVPDVDGQFIEVETGDAMPLTINHRLDRKPTGFLITWKDGFTDVYLSAEDKTEVTINRSIDKGVHLIIY